MSTQKFKKIIKKINPYATLIVALISLFNLYSTNYLNNQSSKLKEISNTLMEQSNQLNENQMKIESNISKLQHEIYKITNFNATIFGGEKFVHLESINIQNYQNGTLNHVILRGNLSTTINIITPHYGRAEIIITNFSRTKEIYRKGTEEYTEVKFVRQPQYLYTYQGLNIFNMDIPLACSICPISYLIPAPGKSTPEFIIGILDFQIIFYDMQALNNATYEFSTEVHGIIHMPSS